MKNLFKKEGLHPTDKEIMEYPMHPDTYSVEILKVHTEFTTAGEKLYQEALTIINSTKLLNEDKVKRLQKLGFTATKEVIEAQQVLRERALNEELVKRIAYYHEQYPLYKFITADQVQAICRKYGLVYGKIDQYTGFVPEKNLKMMESFALKDKDACHYWTGGWGRSPIKIKYEEYLTYKKREPNDVTVDKSFLIAAPAKDFNIGATQEIRNHQIVDKPVPDPVVLAPVEGGYLIVTAWGEEASDPIVQNEINN